MDENAARRGSQSKAKQGQHQTSVERSFGGSDGGGPAVPFKHQSTQQVAILDVQPKVLQMNLDVPSGEISGLLNNGNVGFVPHLGPRNLLPRQRQEKLIRGKRSKKRKVIKLPRRAPNLTHLNSKASRLDSILSSVEFSDPQTPKRKHKRVTGSIFEILHTDLSSLTHKKNNSQLDVGHQVRPRYGKAPSILQNAAFQDYNSFNAEPLYNSQQNQSQVFGQMPMLKLNRFEKEQSMLLASQVKSEAKKNQYKVVIKDIVTDAFK